MQKKECVCGVPLTKKEFVDIINRLRESSELVASYILFYKEMYEDDMGK